MDATGNQAPILQILFMEADPHHNFNSLVAAQAGGVIQFSKCAQQPMPVLTLLPVPLGTGTQSPSTNRKRTRSNSNTPSKKANNSTVAVVDSPMAVQPSLWNADEDFSLRSLSSADSFKYQDKESIGTTHSSLDPISRLYKMLYKSWTTKYWIGTTRNRVGYKFKYK